MFETIVNGHRHTTPTDVATLAISSVAHAFVAGVVIAVPLMMATGELPTVPHEIVRYVTVAAPPPPPPPAPPAANAAVRRPSARVTPVPRPAQEVPAIVAREVLVVLQPDDEDGGEGLFENIDGVPGGVDGGVPGGVVGGVIGGIDDLPPPPLSSAPAAVRPPVRTGGQLQPPALLTRVPPVYPPLAVSAQVQGTVILEATVGRDGRVEAVTVLRSIALLDKAAIEAVRQWVYQPLRLNGQAERFILTVTVSFSLA